MKSLVVVAIATAYFFNGEDPRQMLDTQFKSYTTMQSTDPACIERYQKKLLDSTRHMPPSARKFLDTNIDWEVYAESVFRPNWDKLTKAQQKEFKGVLQREAIDRYGDLFSPSMKFSVKFNGDTQYKLTRGHRFAMVSTTISSLKSDAEVDADFVFHLGPEQWALSDIYLDGVSKSRTYRQEVRKIYKKEGYEGVVRAFQKLSKDK
jgi:ABC-type transporter MlaC component